MDTNKMLIAYLVVAAGTACSSLRPCVLQVKDDMLGGGYEINRFEKCITLVFGVSLAATSGILWPIYWSSFLL